MCGIRDITIADTIGSTIGGLIGVDGWGLIVRG